MIQIPKKETLIVEFKSDKKKLPDSDLVEAVIGMANTMGGELYLGIEDNGSITGIDQSHMDINGIVALIANMTVPTISVRAEILDEIKPIIRIEVPKSRAIAATSGGKVLRRRLKVDGTPENIPMYPYEITSRLSDLSLLDFSNQPLSGASTDDFDVNERVRLRKIISSRRGDTALIGLNDEELDKALRFVREENGILYPTVTGMLMIGKEEKIEELIPTAKSTFQVLEGTNVKVNLQSSKPLLAVFEMFEEYLKPWNPERELELGLLRFPIPEFSPEAFREGLVNAFCHRDYTILQSVRVLIDDEGMTISSPGGFIEGVTLDNLLTVEPHGRNQSLADALKRVGLAEKTGRGIDRIFEGSILYGRPWPDYSESTEKNVKLFIQRAKPDINFIRMITNEENRLGRRLPINSLLILSVLQSEKRLLLSEIVKLTRISESRVKSNLEKLTESGLIEAIGSGKSKAFILSANVYRENSNLVGYVRQTGIDSIRNEEMILKLARQQDGWITREDVTELLKLTKGQAYGTLKRLADSGKLKLEGKGRGSKYKIVTSD
ncbi:ATP-binding protein [Youngiibacter fragilis]|uniref:ATPase AAA n=1 Tax=Youngiibacter fragilis 232.1 TaxID=994573 RepID=V7I744_9CLOT|nr:ATP-binding protein [Youngiibacter fragilis]ETA81044.1 ATPase AAA [Youngiibacter fragilis 232.1]